MHTEFRSGNENSLTASMKVSYRIAREGEAHTFRGRGGGELAKPCVFDLAACMVDEEAARKILLVLLSDIMIAR
jgi:hypothetical protein